MQNGILYIFCSCKMVFYISFVHAKWYFKYFFELSGVKRTVESFWNKQKLLNRSVCFYSFKKLNLFWKQYTNKHRYQKIRDYLCITIISKKTFSN